MFPAPPFSMFRYAIVSPDKPQGRDVPGRVRLSDFWWSDYSDNRNEYSLGELVLFLDKSDFASAFHVDDGPIVEV